LFHLAFPTVLSCVFRSLALPLALAFAGMVSLRAEVSIGRSVGAARIAQVASLSATDLVILDAGFEAGLRQGMVCTVTRDGANLGELLLVDLRPRAASALILDLSSGQGLQPGDLVAVKTVSSRK
jgi:hypothetical protein